MTSVDFCYWLQGLFELADPQHLDARQTDLVKRHLAMVFLHDIDRQIPAEKQAALNEAHAPVWMTDPVEHEKQGRPRC